MDFKITIEQFEGPLDLMLHLIRENKLDLFDLDLLTLANQYIAYIHQMKEMHLEVASEYLTELASLVEYKSRKLLPREEPEIEDEYQEEQQRDELVQRLLEYQRYKEISSTFKDAFEQRQHLYTRPQASMVEEWARPTEAEGLLNLSPYELMKAMRRVIQRNQILQPYETQVTIKELSVEERLLQIKERIEAFDRPVSFETLCDDCRDLHTVIVTFLAILDLIYQKELSFVQDEQGQIVVMKEALS